MRCRAIWARRAALALLLLRATPALAGDCEAEARAAETRFDVPAELLTAIGRVESGRAIGGRIAPWPWSVNAAGEGHYLASAADAVALVRRLQAQGIRSIDVGCFQMNLLYHPQAFASLEEAFEPAANALAAAGFLRQLRDAAGGWEAAVGRYHSANPALGAPYLSQVLASWHGGAAMLAAPLSQVAALVRVIVPQGASAPASATPVRAVMWAPRGVRLPVVIGPSGVSR